ncbi:hypothetical protein QMK17_13495 [Rhodococcus sp. G-MC3]|uniref:hypothetical protein n=1 Tax=Rhodococcus sp. G-MC3 TaxID=3046209 RepID=UPI0024BAB81E|nr:hypothetical protein [Rhodococcus sp. G-MC3]MDJ0394342.1 hypothetical protein [Rhodococcus sp. G-MC3]
MSVPLTLGVPHRPDPQALIAGLLQQRYRRQETLSTTVSAGPRVIAASDLLLVPAGADLGRIVVDLDIDPDELKRDAVATYEVVRFHIDVDESTMPDALALRLPSPLVVFPELLDASALDVVTAIADAHRTPGFAASASPRHIAAVLAVVAHAEVGFVARASSGVEVLAILGATVAALRGDNIPAALAGPDLAALAALRPEAAEAVRTVLLGIEIDDAAAAHRDLVTAGLAT